MRRSLRLVVRLRTDEGAATSRWEGDTTTALRNASRSSSVMRKERPTLYARSSPRAMRPRTTFGVTPSSLATPVMLSTPHPPWDAARLRQGRRCRRCAPTSEPRAARPGASCDRPDADGPGTEDRDVAPSASRDGRAKFLGADPSESRMAGQARE